MKKKTVVTIALVSIPLIVGGFFIFKALNNGGKNPKPLPTPTPTPSTTTSSKSDFPLKKGSNNKFVGALQALLNTLGEKLKVDNAFGKLTEAALKKHFNITEIATESDFNNLKNQLASTDLKVKNLDYGWKLINAYNAGASNLVALDNFSCQGKFKDVFGGYRNNGKMLSFAKGMEYNTTDYSLINMLSDGTLLIKVNSGTLAGLWATRPETDLKNSLVLE